MESLNNINLLSLADTAVSFTTAFFLGGLIGLERQFRQRTAGLRTNVLVALGAAIFVDAANRLLGHEGAVHVMAYVVSGIGFLGAGVIMREEGNVRGINTAATLWGSGAVGALAGGDLILEAILATFFVLAANTLLRPIVTMINRQPLDTQFVEVTNSVFIITPKHSQKKALKQFIATLEAAGYQTQDIEVKQFGSDEVEIQAVLTASSVDGERMDHLIAGLSNLDYVNQAFWSPSTTD
ncbi:MAG: methyltransferase [Polynucleobacter sp. 24-46-87]|jgi:putative Mg2+ transporter-C (MgtC) family protein|nr:MAG: methyltransferase [Polynucleobacter sp. 35-46-207]OYZ39032.1 MAG: methyltransferase [Polynucleobacter sp. 16-46-70]OZA15079.1 MAG: methyltransferase [Polynucleobacter sp. 24-46-87]OZA42114.1 MAG: methyltransferase [Polynucleobacter sp. 17-46-58]OZB49643.1 MAG: methyltransferase [Polynucleobacter sp. 39-45-136]HQR83390.1 MgtC/SapB family protein [Polynucleobacter sp.]